MAVELFNDGNHIVHAFYDLVDDTASGAVQCNQFLVVNHGHGALIDPGGNMTYTGLLMDMQKHFSSKDLDYILASHPDPDIIASVNKWFIASHCKVMISITRLAGVFVRLGVRKLRLTGGEPLLRRGLPRLIEQLGGLRSPEGEALDLTLNTNGSLLARQARALKEAGLQRITVSLDALDDAVCRRMNDVDFPVSDVLAGLDAAQSVGLGPIKVNMVVQRGVNDHEVEGMAAHFRGTGMVLRFIEFMDVGSHNDWRLDRVLPSRELVQRIGARWPLRPLQASKPGETAERWAYVDGGGEIGFISEM